MTNRRPAWRCFPLRSIALLLPVFLGWAFAAPAWAGAQAPDALAEQLKSPDADSRAKAAREIGKSDDRAALPALEAALRDPSDKVRREVVMALASFRQPEALDALITATRDSNPDVRTLAVESLVGYYTGQAPSPGFTGFLKRGAHAAKSIFSDEDTARI
ncbi:MAG TPA: HEAT repeat domain-containing protein, partial [Terriglobia bacterium]|nr:HEAT repeat domain-containing protein [Terriglobia bacterium]